MRRKWLGLIILVGACQGTLQTSTTAQESVVISPSTYDFGALQVGMTSAPRTIQVNPALGNQYDVVTAVTESCPDFFVTANGLPAEVYRVCESGVPLAHGGGPVEETAAPCTTTDYQAYAFSTQFQPNIGAATSCVVTIVLQSGLNRTVTLSGTGTIPPVAIDVTPSSVAFGDVRRNTTSTAAQINVRNLGGQTMTVSSVSASAGFMITSGPTSTTVGPSGSQPYGVVCQPTAVGGMSGSFTVQSNDPAKPTVTVPLSCNGIDSNLDISPSPVSLPTTRVGEPVEQNITLVNSGAAAMTIQSIALASADIQLIGSPGPGTVLGSGGSATARVRFEAGAAATAQGVLTVTYDGGQTRTSQISARALATSMALTPDGDVDLGPICIGQTREQPFTIVANADADFVISAISAPEAPFSLMSPTLPASVKGAGGSTLTFGVRAMPAAPGPVMSSMLVTTDIPASAPREIRLTATALTEGVGGAPELLDLGSQPLDVTTIGQEVSIANCTTTPVNLTNARIEGLDAASFAIVQQPMSGTVAANGVAKWLVVFTPRTAGQKTATFSVDHEGGTTSVMLAGEGLGDSVIGGGGGPPSYYACSTGGATAAGPLVLVLVFALRRRRR